MSPEMPTTRRITNEARATNAPQASNAVHTNNAAHMAHNRSAEHASNAAHAIHTWSTSVAHDSHAVLTPALWNASHTAYTRRAAYVAYASAAHGFNTIRTRWQRGKRH